MTSTRKPAGPSSTASGFPPRPGLPPRTADAAPAALLPQPANPTKAEASLSCSSHPSEPLLPLPTRGSHQLACHRPPGLWQLTFFPRRNVLYQFPGFSLDQEASFTWERKWGSVWQTPQAPTVSFLRFPPHTLKDVKYLGLSGCPLPAEWTWLWEAASAND